MRSTPPETRTIRGLLDNSPWRGHVLVSGTVAVFVLLLIVELFTLRSWVQSRAATEELAARVVDVTQLANVHREAWQLVYDAENLDESVSRDELVLQRDLLENHVRRLIQRSNGLDAAMVAELRTDLDAFDRWLRSTAGVPDSDLGPASAEGLRLATEVELAVKRIYDRAETPYFLATQAALNDQHESKAFLLVTTGLLGVFAVVALVATRRAARAQRDEAFDAIAVREQQHRHVLDSVNDVIFSADTDGRWRFLSAAWERLTGRAVADCLGIRFSEFVHPDDREGCEANFWSLRAGETGRRHEARFLRADGSAVWAEVWAASDLGTGTTAGTVVDITERRRYEAQLHHQATHDTLTGLPNRDELASRLDQVISASAGHGRRAGILFLDLDRFKLVTTVSDTTSAISC